CLEYSNKSVVGIAVAFIHDAATADAAYADVPAPQITAARPSTISRALLAATRETVVAHNSGCWRISLNVIRPRPLRSSEFEFEFWLAAMNRSAFLDCLQKFVCLATQPLTSSTSKSASNLNQRASRSNRSRCANKRIPQRIRLFGSVFK